MNTDFGQTGCVVQGIKNSEPVCLYGPVNTFQIQKNIEHKKVSRFL